MSAQARGSKYDWDSMRYNFNYFNSYDDFMEKGYEAINRNSQKTPNYEDLVNKSYADNFLQQQDYRNKDYLFEQLEKLETAFAQVDMGGTFKKSRLKITSDERGVFSFGLASQGLFKPQEYFSQELADDNPNEFPEKPSGIVPSDQIEFVEIFSKMQYWYTSETTNKKYLCVRQQEGTREVNLGLRQKPIFRTKTKKSYVMFEKKGGKAKMVELFVPLHGSIYLGNVLPLYLVVKFLRQMNIMVRINSIRMYAEADANSNRKKAVKEFYGWVVPIKDFGEDIDYNDIAKKTEDDNWWRTMYTMLRAMTDDAKYNGKAETIGQGDDAEYRDDYNNVFSRYKNWYMEKIAKGEVPPLRVDKRLLLFGGAFSSTSDEGIIAEFNRIIDLVDFQFNNVDGCLKRIYKREVTDKLEKYFEQQQQQNWGYSAGYQVTQSEIDRAMERTKENYTKEFKQYITIIFTDTYTYPIRGQYPTPSQEAEKIETEFDDKILKLNTFLKNI
jgi:hypothetical protein